MILFSISNFLYFYLFFILFSGFIILVPLVVKYNHFDSLNDSFPIFFSTLSPKRRKIYWIYIISYLIFFFSIFNFINPFSPLMWLASFGSSLIYIFHKFLLLFIIHLVFTTIGQSLIWFLDCYFKINSITSLGVSYIKTLTGLFDLALGTCIKSLKRSELFNFLHQIIPMKF